jgi:hypothetical protein
VTNPLAPLAAYRQFVVYKYFPKPSSPEKMEKVPLQVSGANGSVTNPSHWVDWGTAYEAATRLGAGHSIGFVLTESDPFWCLDIDGCIKPDGTYTQIVHDIAAQIGNGVVWEVSMSGKGLHLWGRGAIPEHGCRNQSLGLELYHTDRFIALGRVISGDMSVECPGIHSVISRYFAAPTRVSVSVPDDGPVEEWLGPSDDDDLIRRALLGKAAVDTEAIFGGGSSRPPVTFHDLWTRNVVALAARWPDDSAEFNHSAADGSLAERLAWWTGKDVARIDRLMRKSALVRDKWDSMRNGITWLQDTILKSCSVSSKVLRDTPSAVMERLATLDMPTGGDTPDTAAGVIAGGSVVDEDEAEEMPEPKDISGRTFANRDDQRVLFRRCCYVASENKVLMPNGMLLDPPRFKVMMSGFTFTMGGAKGKTTANAWEAFTESQESDFPKADGVCFRPDKPFGMRLKREGVWRVNKYLPPNVRMVEGDASPMLNHLKLLLPNGDDAIIFLSYLAACVQYPGRKFPWAPVLQGVQGNGKTMFSVIAAYSVGKKYTHWPKASKLTAQFNKWMIDNVLYCVEDIHSKGNSDVVMEELKPMITGGRGLEIEGKGADQYSTEIVGNFIINCNSKDGIRKSADDRRYAMLFSAQQTPADLVRDFGKDVSGYMNRLYGWLDNENGLPICAHYLKHMPIPHRFDPTKGAQRAPETSSHAEAVAAGLGMIEQTVQEAIDEDRIGFRGGWVSGNAVKKLLAETGKDRFITPNKRKEVISNLGYVPHPGLNGGRTDNQVMPDGTKVHLFVKPGSAQWGLVGAAEIAKAYTKAQTHG